MPTYFRVHRQNETSAIPSFLQTSGTTMPDSACLWAKAICFSENVCFKGRILLPRPESSQEITRRLASFWGERHQTEGSTHTVRYTQFQGVA